MAWTAPMTAVAGSPLTAAQWNTHVRDNFNETAPGKATQSGSYFVGNGPNSIVERVIDMDEVLGVESRSSTSYGNLATVGPTVSLQTGAFAMIFITAHAGQSVDNASCFASVAVTGATTIAASDDTALQHDLGDADNAERKSVSYGVNLTPGLNTFTLKYRVAVGTGTWRRRQLTVMPF